MAIVPESECRTPTLMVSSSWAEALKATSVATAMAAAASAFDSCMIDLISALTPLNQIWTWTPNPKRVSSVPGAPVRLASPSVTWTFRRRLCPLMM